MRRLIPDQRRRQPCPFSATQPAERRTARGLARRRKAQHQERQRRQARQHQRGDRGVRPRHRADRQSLGQCRAHQPVTRIGHQRHTGIGHQRDAPAFAQPRQHRRNGGVLVVLVQRLQLHLRADGAEQPCRVTRVLAEDQVGGQQRLARAERQVAEVADRSGNQHKTIGQDGLSVPPVVRRCGACFVGHSCSFSAH